MAGYGKTSVPEAPAPGSWELKVRYALTGECLAVPVSPCMPIMEVKEALEKLTQTPSKFQQLLTDDGSDGEFQDPSTTPGTAWKTVSDAGLKPGDCVLLVRKAVEADSLLEACMRSDPPSMLHVRYSLKNGADLNLHNTSERHYPYSERRAKEGKHPHGFDDVFHMGNAFHWAVLNGHYEICRMLLEDETFTGINAKAYDKEIDDDETFADDLTALHLAVASRAERGNDICRLLLESPRFNAIDATDDYGFNALHSACAVGNVDAVRLLLEDSRVDVNAHVEGFTALHFAVQAGHESVCFALLECARFSAADSKDKNGKSAFDWASVMHMGDLCALLITDDMVVHWSSMKDSTPKFNLGIPLHGVSCAGRSDLCCKILAHPEMSQDQANFKSSHADGGTALHGAAAYGHHTTCATLLESAAFTATNTKTKNGKTALHFGAASGHGDVCKLFLDSSDFCEEDATDLDGETALHTAARFGHDRICLLLLEANAFNAGNAKSACGKTALHIAADHGHRSVCRVLLADQGFTSLNEKDADQTTALHLATKRGCIDIMQMLTEEESFSETNSYDKCGRCALDYAAEAGTVDACNVLLNARDFSGLRSFNSRSTSPLHLAAEFGHFAVVALLLEARAEPTLQTSEGITPLQSASVQAHESVVGLLLEAKSPPDASALMKLGSPDISEFRYSTGYEDCATKLVERLLEAKMDLNYAREDEYASNYTPLMNAASHGLVGVVTCLLDAKADPRIRSGPVSSCVGPIEVTALECVEDYYKCDSGYMHGHPAIAIRLRRALVDWGCPADN